MKKIYFSLVSVVLMSASTVLGMPAEQGIVKIYNPDGSVVEVRRFGNEYFSYMTDVSGKVLLEKDANGFIVEAIRNGVVLKADAEGIGTLRSEDMKAISRISKNAPAKTSEKRLPPISEEGRSLFPTIGETRGVVVLLEYADTKFSVPEIKDVIHRYCNEEGYNLYGAKGSVRDYFKATSNGFFTPSYDVYGPVTLPETSQYYTGGYRVLNFNEAASFAIKALDDEVEFSQYDRDGDGLIDNVFFFYAGHGQHDTPDESLVWPHQDDFRKYVKDESQKVMVDGVEFATYACTSELKSVIPEGGQQPWLNGIGTFVHEFGHVFGLPDMYDTEAFMFSTKSPDFWSIMDYGSYNDFSTRPPRYSGYEQWFCKWVEFEEMEPGKKYELESFSSSDKPRILSIKVPKKAGSNEFYNERFILETRTAEGWDEPLNENGLLVWRVDFDATKWSTNKVNTGFSPNIEIIEADRYAGYRTYPGADGEYTYICPGATSSLSPSNKSIGFNAIINEISYNPETKSVSFGYNCASQEDVVTRFTTPYVTNKEKRNLLLSWEPVEGATGYMLSLTCIEDDGWKNTVNGYSKTIVKDNKVELTEIDEDFWPLKIDAELRVITHLPSAKATTFSFVPNKCEDISGVDEVSMESIDVIVLDGRIVAPQGAKVFDLQGRQRNADNLQRGIYFVSFEGKTVKVIVK